MTEVTRILCQIEQGDPAAAKQLLPLVYDELRKLAAAKLAHERPGQTLQATALVHEAYLRLLGPFDAVLQWESRGHFFAAAAEAMRRILIDRVRARGAIKRGGAARKLALDPSMLCADEAPAGLLELDEAIERLEREAPEKAELVKLRFFAGLTLPQVAATLGISTSTADRHWAYARAWLYAELGGNE